MRRDEPDEPEPDPERARDDHIGCEYPVERHDPIEWRRPTNRQRVLQSVRDRWVPGRGGERRPRQKAVVLAGDIVGVNFEPGTCHPGLDSVFGLHCFLFGDGPGEFTRLAQGGVARTTCHCTVGGVGNPGDQVTLKISYPPALPKQYPSGFTKFTFQDGTGALSGLRGEGTLDFGAFPQATFSYHFVP